MKYIGLIAVTFLLILVSPVAATTVKTWEKSFGTSNLVSMDVNSSGAYIATGSSTGYVYYINAAGVQQWSLRVAPDTIDYIRATDNFVFAANTSTLFAIGITTGTLQWSQRNTTLPDPIIGIDAISNGTISIATVINQTWVFNSAGTMTNVLQPFQGGWGIGVWKYPWNMTVGAKITPDGLGIFVQDYGYIADPPCTLHSGYTWATEAYAYPYPPTPSSQVYICNPGDGQGQIAVDPTGTRVVIGSSVQRLLSWDGTTLAGVGSYTSSSGNPTSPISTALVSSNSIVGRGVVVEIVSATGVLTGYDSVGGTVYAVDINSGGSFSTSGGLDGRMRIYSKNTSTTWANIYTESASSVIYAVRLITDGSVAYAARAGGALARYDVSETSADNPPSVQYYPHQVALTFTNQFGRPIPGLLVTTTGTTSSSPVSWITDLLGISSSVNTSATLSGYTDTSGSITFLMIEFLKYDLSVTNTTAGISKTFSIYPRESVYTFRIDTAATVYNLYDNVWWNLSSYDFSATEISMNLSVNGTMGQTTSVIFYVNGSLNLTPIYSKTLTLTDNNNGTAGLVVVNTKGEALAFGLIIIHTTFGTITDMKGITMDGPAGKFVDMNWPPQYYTWASLFILALVICLFSGQNSKFGSVIFPFVAAFLFWIGWITISWVLLGSIIVMGVIHYLVKSEVKAR